MQETVTRNKPQTHPHTIQPGFQKNHPPEINDTENFLNFAYACKQLRDEGKTPEETARLMGCYSLGTIEIYLPLVSLPEQVLDSLRAGLITALQALTIGKYYPDSSLEVLERFEKDNFLEWKKGQLQKAQLKKSQNQPNPYLAKLNERRDD